MPETAERTGIDLSRFDQLSMQASSKKRPCPIGFMRPQLSETKRAQFDAAQARPLYSNTVLIAWCEEAGFEGITNSAMTSHRKGTCTCRDAQR